MVARLQVHAAPKRPGIATTDPRRAVQMENPPTMFVGPTATQKPIAVGMQTPPVKSARLKSAADHGVSAA